MISTRVLIVVLIAAVAYSEASYKPVFYPFGPQTNVPLNQLVGWKRCWMNVYNSTTDTLLNVFNNCTGAHLLYGCRNNTYAQSFTLLAVGSRAIMLNDTGYSADIVSVDNGVGFYYNNLTSIGFAKEGDTVNRDTCDTGSDNAEYRLCWHTSNYNSESGQDEEESSFDPGYRCGATDNLNNDDQWIREIWMPADPCEGKAEGDMCNDYDPCTSATTCQSGVCRGRPACGCMECDANLGCLTTSLANGTLCDDDNLCTESDTCQSGVCVGSSPKLCLSEQQCFNSTCVPTTGKCQLTAIEGCTPQGTPHSTPVSLITNSGASKSSLASIFIIALTALLYL